MPIRPLRVVIVGAGTAGPAAALLLARAGHSVTLLERAPDLRPIGAGLLLQPTGLAILSRLGLLSTVLRCGARVTRLHGVTRAGRTVLDLPYGHLREGLFGLGIHRGALFSALFAPLASAGVTVRTATTAIRIEQSGAATVRVIDDHGADHGPFDLAIVADGARSSLRAASGFGPKVRKYPWGALWFVAEEREGIASGVLEQTFHGTSRMIGFLPSGTTDVAAQGPRTTSIFWSIAASQIDAVRAGGLDQWKRDVLDLAPRAEPLIAQVSSVDQLLFAEYRDAVMRQWHDPSGLPIVYIGDAAHAMSPVLGQGANLALQDAWTLADCIATATSLTVALKNYTRTRRPQLAYYQFVTRVLTPVFQSSIEPLAWARDLFWGPACRFPLTRTQFLQGQAGIKSGFFSSMPLPDRVELVG